jgi:alpha-methylacyl-CoA racemase
MTSHAQHHTSCRNTEGGEETPLPPANFAGDYAGGGVMLAMGVLLAWIEREKSGTGQVIDVAMTDGANYV